MKKTILINGITKISVNTQQRIAEGLELRYHEVTTLGNLMMITSDSPMFEAVVEADILNETIADIFDIAHYTIETVSNKQTSIGAYITQEFKKNKFQDFTIVGIQHLLRSKDDFTQEQYEIATSYFVNLLVEKLKDENCEGIEFVYEDKIFDIFLSQTNSDEDEEDNDELNYVVNIYPDSPFSKDENDDFIEDQEIDGGLCTGGEENSIRFMM